MALALADLLGTPADGTDLDRNIEIGKKATGASSAIAAGRVVFHTQSNGQWAIATAGSTGRMGIVPKLHPLNVDADDTLQVATGVNSAWYVEAAGEIKPGSRCMPTTGGKVIAYVAGDVTATPTESTIESAIKDFERAPFVYEGHYGEGSGLHNDPTDAANAEPVRVRIAQ
jgi:hypothetical protein